MVLRIPVKIKFKDRIIEAKALLNTGFEAPEPIISIPLELAETLNLEIGSVIEFEGAGLIRGSSYYGGNVELIVNKNGIIRRINVKVLITPGENEIVLSDKCIEELGIIIDLKNKRWWFT